MEKGSREMYSICGQMVSRIEMKLGRRWVWSLDSGCGAMGMGDGLRCIYERGLKLW